MSTATKAICAHCGTPFTPRAKESYCCHGCEYVAQVLSENDLTRFYELKGNTAVPPVGSKAFTEAEVAPLIAELKRVEANCGKPVAHTRFCLEGISCIGCVWLIEAIFQRQPGSARVRIDPRASAIEMYWQRGHFNVADFAQEIQKIGYRLTLYTEDPQANTGSRQIIHRLGLCGFFLLNTMLFTLPAYLGMGGDFFLAPLFQLLGATFATLSLITGGGYFIQRAWQAARNRVLHIDLPIAAGLLAGYIGSLLGWATGYVNLIYFDFVATFVFLMLLGRWLQEYALEKNRSHLQRQKAGPRNVTLIGGAQDGQSIPASQITAELQYSVAPGEINPVAADPLDAQGSLSLEWINGEADPVTWPQNRTAPAGAINVGLHSLRFRAREAWDDSLLAQLLERPEDGFQERRLQTVLKYYIASVLVVAAIGSLSWLLTSGDWLKSTQVLISVLIVSCPCALGVALPMCDEFANARLRRSGLFIKSAQIWERLRQVRTVVFDKTGTLTMDIPRLLNTAAIKELDSLAAQALQQLVEHNRHPIARSLREALLAAFPKLRSDNSAALVEETIGQGVAWKDAGGNEWTLGKPDWRTAKLPAGRSEYQQAGSSPLRPHTCLRQNGLLVAGFNFQEDVRDDAREAIDHIRSRQMDTAILSGDAPERVQTIATQLGIECKAQCSPRDKANWIEARAPQQALMIGDGANDSLAFDAAICRGTPVVDKSILEASADFFFFGRSLRSLPQLFQVAASRRLTITTIFTVAVLYNISAVGICLAGHMHPLMAAILMPLSSLVTLGLAWLGLGRQTQKT
ncbi:heavy metal translocating P-type ATPase metal-binding domain-containing protein [Coraliomargarita algicola]|uniref:Heavy metal translocating P-type ATPase metal-binding domain-containing protein n=1 Tax=Coraliomargarita algicola TaxID=3092156 RepID=A0ABZ0RNH3_9BACT|nr:heavy metal translocating P-type ATPase metal-binding domain-containing protein [Coraliomargarita sp. J2-16]WPJ97667.1 heavy metal translocating P-type ATPase metal-binding domain-containing protein [Coraliomargarita sp. J2-16]